MSADVTKDRRVTVPNLGSNDTAHVDGSRLLWALPSLVHERLGYRRPRARTGYKVMRCCRMLRTRPSPGSCHPLNVETNRTDRAMIAPCSTPSKLPHAVLGVGLTTDLTSPPRGA